MNINATHKINHKQLIKACGLILLFQFVLLRGFLDREW